MSQPVKFKKAQASVVVYDWDNKTPSDDTPLSELSKTTRIFLSNNLTAINFSKDLNSPSGSFEITLDSSRDWRRVIRRGTWATIFMSNEENIPLADIPDPQFLRTLCYIERISERIQEDEDGSRDLTYVVTGRDFGKIYEDTEIWQNYFKFEKTLSQTLSATLTLENISTTDKLLDLGHKLFFSAKDDIAGNATIAEIAQQWLMPEALLVDLDLKTRTGTQGPFFGHIQGLLNFSPTNTSIPITNPMAAINGNAWAKLKEWSVEPLNELFCELNSIGAPQLTYRPIPWGISQKGYPTLAKNISTYRKLAEDSNLIISNEEITFVDIGEDEHNRYNHFFGWSSAQRHSQFDNISELQNKVSATGRSYPYVKRASVMRHGFKPMHTELNTITYSVKRSKNGKVNTKLLLEYNEVLYDYWSPAVFFESGSVSIVGRNDIKIGQAIIFEKGAKGKLGGKVFYVEGYSDEYLVDEDGKKTWFQNLQLTRGIEAAKLRENIDEEELEKNNTIETKGFFIKD